MNRVLNIEPICAGLWRVTTEADGELLVNVLHARDMNEAWEKVMRPIFAQV